MTLPIPDCTHDKTRDYVSIDGKRYCHVCTNVNAKRVAGSKLPFCDFCSHWVDRKLSGNRPYALCTDCYRNIALFHVNALLMDVEWDPVD